MFIKGIALALVGGLLSLSGPAAAQEPPSPTVTVVNTSADPVLVKFVGPTSGILSVSPGGAATSAVSGGGYYLKLRYGASDGHYRYARTADFQVTQSAYSVSRITITLHSVAGNMNEREISPREF
jgi:hypothetical protein